MPGKTDDQSVAACRAAPLLAGAVRRIRAAGRLGVKLLEEPLVAAFGAVPAQIRHPGEPPRCGAQETSKGLNGLDADRDMLSCRFVGSQTACLTAAYHLMM